MWSFVSTSTCWRHVRVTRFCKTKIVRYVMLCYVMLCQKVVEYGRYSMLVICYCFQLWCCKNHFNAYFSDFLLENIVYLYLIVIVALIWRILVRTNNEIMITFALLTTQNIEVSHDYCQPAVVVADVDVEVCCLKMSWQSLSNSSSCASICAPLIAIGETCV